MSEMPSVYRLQKRTARKEHKCCECRGKINPGEQYNCHSGIWDGRAEEYKECSDCAELRAELDAGADYPEECTAFTELVCRAADAGVPEFISRLIAIKEKRGAELPLWMIDWKQETKGASHEH